MPFDDDCKNSPNEPFERICVYFHLYICLPLPRKNRTLELPVSIDVVKLAKGEHKTDEFLRVNKFGQVPVLVERDDANDDDDDDDDSMRFVLTESSAILKYLSETFSRTVSASKMYAENEHDLKEKAKIWSAMDWYQTTIRSSAAGLSWHAFVAQNMGGALSLELSKHYEGRLKLSLDVLETKWLGDSSPFLNERPHPSIADLLVVEDIVNLVVLKGSPFRSQLSSLEELLRTRPRIRKWIDAVSRLNRPAWDELHRVLDMVAASAEKKMNSGVRGHRRSNSTSTRASSRL